MRTVLCVYAIMMAFGGGVVSAQPAEPVNDRVRAFIERNTVVLEVFDVGADANIANGTAFVIGQNGDVLVLGTAEHVLEKYRAAIRDQLEVEVRAWVESPREFFRVSVAAPHDGELGTPVDFCALAASSTEALKYINPVLDKPLIAPVPTRDSQAVYSYGWDREKRRLSWCQRGWVRRVTDSSIEFVASQVLKGRSGSLLCSGSGAFGMIRARGGHGRVNRAVPLSLIAELVERSGHPGMFASSEAAERLEFAYDERLLIGVYGIEKIPLETTFQPVWYVIELEETIDSGYRGKIHSSTVSAPVVIEPTPAGLSLRVERTVGWVELGERGKVPGGSYEWEQAPDQALDGMLVMRCEHRRTFEHDPTRTVSVDLWMALPQRRQELLASRMLMSNKDLFRYGGNYQNEMIDLFVNRGAIGSGAVQKKVRPFTNVMYASRSTQCELVIPGRVHRDRRVELFGRVLWPDFAKQHWPTEREPARSFSLDATALPAHSAARVTLDHAGDEFRVSWIQRDEIAELRFSQATHTAYAMLFMEGAILRYD